MHRERMHANDSQTLNVLSVIIDLLFIVTYALGAAVFNLFLNWYDTGELRSDGAWLVAISGIILGGIAFSIERRLFQRRGSWPRNPFLFFARLIMLSVLYIDLGFAIGSSAGYALHEVINGVGIRSVVSGLLLTLASGMFYLLMIIPFGVIVGLVAGFLLKINPSFRSS